MDKHPQDLWETIKNLKIPQEEIVNHLDGTEELDAKAAAAMGRKSKNKDRESRYVLAVKLLRSLGMDSVSLQELKNHKEKIDIAVKNNKVSEDSVYCLIDNLGILITKEVIRGIHNDVRTQLATALNETEEYPTELQIKGIPIKSPTYEMENNIRSMCLRFFSADSEE